MSYTRSFQLRRQYSVACESIDRQQLSASKDRRARLQKQLSADQSTFIRDSARSIGHSRRPKTSTLNSNLNDGLPETSLRVFTAYKNKNNLIHRSSEPPIQNNGLHQHEHEATAKKSYKQNEQKNHINIFLAQRISEMDVGSDSEGSAKTAEPKMGIACDNADNSNKSNSIFIANKPSAADARRAIFRRKCASLNEMRPRLTRAMSAPIHSNASNDYQNKKQHINSSNNSNNNNNSSSSNSNNNGKKRVRRKKIASIDIDSINMNISPNQIYQHAVDRPPKIDPSNMETFTARYSKEPKQSKPIAPTRTKSGINVCDIVTLVSLLSPGASDSEKEDTSTNTEMPNEKQKPPLRKMGKSVSFQDDDGNIDDDPLIDLPSVLRRASLVPLASRIRLNRPPTAPPGSIFHKSTVINNINGMNADINPTSSTECKNIQVMDQKSPFNLNESQITKASIEIVNPPCALRKPSIDLSDPNLTFPEYVRSIKEKECWMLFQKMINKGISVTYETILRGVLTPSEFRVVERKQKEIIDRMNDEATADETNK